MSQLNILERMYWGRFIRSLRPDDRPLDPIVKAAHAGTPKITDELLSLYFTGRKTAGSGIVEDYQSAGDALPKVGNFWIYLDGQGEPRCILRTDRVEINKFKDVPLSVAIAEGEGDLSLEHWRRVHSELYVPLLEGWGVKQIEDATVITEFFSMAYR